MSVLPVSTVCCKRGFSQMNLLKNNLRSLLQPQILSELMMIKMNGPLLMELNPEQAVDQWFVSSKS
jgi:hypothetical protein